MTLTPSPESTETGLNSGASTVEPSACTNGHPRAAEPIYTIRWIQYVPPVRKRKDGTRWWFVSEPVTSAYTDLETWDEVVELCRKVNAKYREVHQWPVKEVVCQDVKKGPHIIGEPVDIREEFEALHGEWEGDPRRDTP